MRYAVGQQRGVPDIWLLLVLFLGAAVRIPLLTDARFHPDEALFATLGRLIISGQDPLLADTTLLVDKPPLFYYTLALLISICWGCEMTARLIGLFSSLITIALTARLASRIYSEPAAPLIAALVIALSPMAILFSVTVFADPLLVMWLLASCILGWEGRSIWGGLCFGLALASKQNAVLVAPLLLWFLVLASDRTQRPLKVQIGRLALGTLCIALGLVVWDFLRSPDLGFWQTGFARNNPGRLIRRNEVLPRLQVWWSVIRTFAPGWFTTTLLLLAGFIAMLLNLFKPPRQAAALSQLALAVFGVTYFAFHWLVAFPLFDRYFLVLVPIVAIVSGGALASFLSRHQNRWPTLAAIVLIVMIVLLPHHISRAGVGGDRGASDGIDQVAAYLRDRPDGTIVYHRSLGWLTSYYLFDAYVVPVTIDSPDALSADLIAFSSDPSERYLVLTPQDGATEMKRAIGTAGYAYQKVLVTNNRYGMRSFIVLRLTNLPNPDL